MLTVNITYKHVTLSSSCMFCNLPGTYNCPAAVDHKSQILCENSVQAKPDPPSVGGGASAPDQPDPWMHGMAHVRAKDLTRMHIGYTNGVLFHLHCICTEHEC